MQNEGGHSDSRQDIADVYQSVQASEGQCRTGPCAVSLISRPPVPEDPVARHAGTQFLDTNRATPFPLNSVIELLSFFRGRCPNVVRGPNTSGEYAESDQGAGAFRVRGGEKD